MLSITPDELRKGKAGIIDSGDFETGVTGAAVYILGPELKPDMMQVLTHIAVINKTNAYTRLRVGIWDGASFHVLEEEQNPSANQYYFSPNDVLIRPGSQIQAELTGTVTGDDLEMVTNGVWVALRR